MRIDFFAADQVCRKPDKMNSISTALPAIQAATAHVENGGKPVIIFYTPGFQAPDPVQSSTGSSVEATSSSAIPESVQTSPVDLPAKSKLDIPA
jgi:hypothetical protein